MSSQQTTTLKDVLVLADSGTWGDEPNGELGAPVLRSTNIQDGKLSLEDPALRIIPRGDVERKKLDTGDIIVTASSGSPDLIGKCCCFDQPEDGKRYYFSNFTFRLRPDPLKADSHYIYHWLISPMGRAVLGGMNNTTSGLRNLNKSLYLEQAVPLPPLPEQRRIAEILDKAYALRAKRRQVIAKLESLSSSIFASASNANRWQRLTVQDMRDRKMLLLHKDGNHGSLYPRSDDFGDMGVAFLSAKSVTDDGALIPALVERLRDEKAARLKIGWIEKGDVLLAHNATVGRVALYLGEFGKALIGTSLTAFRPNPQLLDSAFLFAAMRSADFQRQLRKIMGQTTRNQVPITAQRDLVLPVPEIEQQRAFGTKVAKIQSLRAALTRSAERMASLCRSLQHLAFAGRLRSAPMDRA